MRWSGLRHEHDQDSDMSMIRVEIMCTFFSGKLCTPDQNICSLSRSLVCKEPGRSNGLRVYKYSFDLK